MHNGVSDSYRMSSRHVAPAGIQGAVHATIARTLLKKPRQIQLLLPSTIVKMEKSLGKYSDLTVCRQASPSDGLKFQKTFAQVSLLYAGLYRE